MTPFQMTAEAIASHNNSITQSGAKTERVMVLKRKTQTVVNSKLLILLVFISIFTVVGGILFVQKSTFKVLETDGDCESVLFQNQPLAYFPLSANETDSYATLQAFVPVTTLSFQSTGWTFIEIITECVDRGRFHLNIHLSCAKTETYEMCIIDKKDTTPCNKTYNTIYFYDTPTQSVFGGVTVDNVCHIQYSSFSCDDRYGIDYAAQEVIFNNLLDLMISNTICTQTAYVPSFVISPTILNAIGGVAIGVGSLTPLIGILVWLIRRYWSKEFPFPVEDDIHYFTDIEDGDEKDCFIYSLKSINAVSQKQQRSNVV